MSAHPRPPRRYFARATGSAGRPVWRLRLPDMIVDIHSPGPRGRRVTRRQRKRIAAFYIHDMHVWTL